jgi:DNA-binding MarR family transcriptional regulator
MAKAAAKDLGKDFDIDEFRRCSCLRLRRLARQATRVYDSYLEPTGLGSNQLILLTILHGAGRQHRDGVTALALAEYFSADPTTLSRNLKPLLRRGLITARIDPKDRRNRLLRISATGKAKLREAGPHWRKAEARMKSAMGAARLRALHELLDRATDGLRA